MIKLVTGVWTGAPGIVGIAGPYPDIVITTVSGDDTPKDNAANKPWMRLSIQHTTSKATSISKRIWRNDGSLKCNVFVFRERTDAPLRCTLVGEAIKQAIRDHRGNVYFKDVTLRERPINNGFNQVDVVADFYWTERSGA